MAALALAAYVAKDALTPSQPATSLALAAGGCAVSLAMFGVVFAGLRRASFSLLSDVMLKLKDVIKNGRVKSADSRA
jgi:hypothetical protein